MSISVSKAVKRSAVVPLVTLVLIVCSSQLIHGQNETIPQALERAGHSLEVGRLTSGRPPSIEAVLRDTDIIVRGRISIGPRSYLSDDQREVYTDYEIRNPEFLYPVEDRTSTPSLVVIKHPGGTVTLNGLNYTYRDDLLPRLPEDTECLLLLKREGQKFRIARRYYGAFSIDDRKLEPLTTDERFASEYRGQSADKVAAEFAAKAREIWPRR